MADVRSLLRNELAARSQSGKTATKKRKIDENDEIPASKRSKTEEPELGPEQGPSKSDLEASRPALEEEEKESGRKQKKVRIAEDLDEVDGGGRGGEGDEAPAVPTEPEPGVETTASKKQEQAAVDEDEWAAFEREVVAPTRVPQSTSTSMPAAVNSSATISAAPVTAAEMAAQQSREADEAPDTRQADVKGEEEDAARYLEEEFEEMEQLEDKVRKLKEKREELRRKREATEEKETVETKAAGEAQGGGDEEVVSAEKAEEEGSGDEGESDEDDEWDDWRFRR